MRDSQYREGQPVKIFHADSSLPLDGVITGVERDLVLITYGSLNTPVPFRRADQRQNDPDRAHLCHFRTLAQVDEETRYSRAVSIIMSHGLIQDTGKRLPLEVLEKIVTVLAEPS